MITLVCPHCFDDKGLKRRIVEIRPDFPDRKCDIHSRYKGVPIKDVARVVDVVFRNNYGLGSYHPMLDDMSGDSLDQVLYDLTGADDDRVVGALAAALVDSDPYWPPDGGEPFYQEDASYERTDDAFQGHGWLWEAFRRTIVYEQRFFNDAAKELLSEIFDGIHRQRDVGRRQPVVVIEPGAPEARFIRARLAEDATTRKDISADPVRQMGPPPQRKRKPGRMNPSGVGAFYAAYDLTTCIAELRPRVGSVVASAEFEIVRPVVALDMTRFAGEPKEPNKFAKDHVKRMAQWRFMQSFMHEIAQPISPDDEHLDYIPTQAVGEYLLRHHRFHLNGVERRIEAIVFRSAQHPAGKNIVLLGDAAVVEAAPSIDGERQTGLGSAFDTLLAQSGPPPFGRLRYRENSLALYRIDEASFRSSRFHEALDFEDF